MNGNGGKPRKGAAVGPAGSVGARARRGASVVAALALLAPGAALAHGGGAADANPWTDWHVTADAVLGAVLASGVYLAGLWRLRDGASRRLRHAAYLGGVAAVFLALASPLDALGERNFSAHQVQHFVLRMLGPMLVMLAAPQAALIAGLPAALRRRAVAPVLESGTVRAVFGALARPAVATALFIAALYVWQIPALHRLALLDDAVHYLMHTTMLAAGLLFFWRVFDARPAPKATGFGVRIVMLMVMLASQIVLGAYLTLKHKVLYPVYDAVGRVGAESAIADETLGGVVIWIPSAMMAILAILIVMHRWGRREAFDDRRRARSVRVGEPSSRAELMEHVSGRNRAMALGFLAVVVVAFFAAIAVGVLGGLVSV